MSYLNQLYSELKLSKEKIYKNYSCIENVLSFIEYLENKKFSKSILDNLYILYFYNAGNGYSLYGKMSFDFHINLLFFDKPSSHWYTLDYDIEKIIESFELDKPLLCSKFLQDAFCTDPAKEQITIAIEENNYYPLRSFQQIMVFTLQEYKNLGSKNSDLINKLRFISLQPLKKEENFLWKLYKDADISFNNLYEFTLFLEKRNPSIELLRSYYQNKAFEEIFLEGFANAEYRLDKEKLLFLKAFLFDSTVRSLQPLHAKAKNDAALPSSSVNSPTLFKPTSPNKERPKFRENAFTFK